MFFFSSCERPHPDARFCSGRVQGLSVQHLSSLSACDSPQAPSQLSQIILNL